MSTATKTKLTPDEYLAIERAAETKSEFWDGEMFAMSGASVAHVTIVTNLVRDLATALRRGPCRVFSADLRLRVTPTGLYTYPDVLVVCGEASFADDQKDTVLNPTLVVEVLSPSTERWDRGRKFEHYRALEPLREYLLVAQDHPHVERYTRKDGGAWELVEASGLDGRLALASVGCDLALANVYEDVTFG